MHTQKTRYLIAAALLGLLSALPAAASENPSHRGLYEEGGAGEQRERDLPDYYPQRFDHEGIMRSLVQGGRMMLGGVRYRVSPNVRVYTPETRNGSVYALREGTEVGIKLDAAGRTVSDIWVLPKGSVVQN